MDAVQLSAPAAVGGDTARAEPIPVFGATVRVQLGANLSSEVLARFSDSSVAVARHTVGDGSVTTMAFLPGLSFFKPALPSRPIDICSRDGWDDSANEASTAPVNETSTSCFSQFIPESFDENAAALITMSCPGSGLGVGSTVAAQDNPTLAFASDKLVEVGVLNAGEARGAVCVLINWRSSRAAQPGLRVSVRADAVPHFASATLASSGRAVPFELTPQRVTFTLPDRGLRELTSMLPARWHHTIIGGEWPAAGRGVRVSS